MKTRRTESSQPAQAAKRLKDKDSWWDDELRRCESEYDYDRESSDDDELPNPENDKYQKKYRCEFIDIGRELASRFGSRDGRRNMAYLFSQPVEDTVPVFCIRPGIPSIVSYVNFYEIMWVGVHGIDTICVVTRNEDVVRVDGQNSNPDYYFPEYSLLCFWNTLISRVEDMADPSGVSRQMSNKSSEEPFSVGPCDESSDEHESSDEPCQMLHKSSKKPFGVFALIGGSDEVLYEASSAQHGKEKAMEFLLQEMASDSAFTFDKTIQTAMAAFQHLFCQKFEAEELRAFVLKNDISLGWELKQVRERVAIEEVIPFINEA